MDLQEKLAAMGLRLPDAPKPVGAYLPSVRVGELVFISGQIPMCDGKLVTGKVPMVVGIEPAQKAAQQCVLNALAALRNEIGDDWSRFVRVVKIVVYVQSDNTFAEQHIVANGASELLQKLFGETGRHARAAVGVHMLPLNAAVEVEAVFQIRG